VGTLQLPFFDCEIGLGAVWQVARKCPPLKRAVLVSIWSSAEGMGDLARQIISFILAPAGYRRQTADGSLLSCGQLGTRWFSRQVADY
jgi:hypothetical protein